MKDWRIYEAVVKMLEEQGLEGDQLRANAEILSCRLTEEAESYIDSIPKEGVDYDF